MFTPASARPAESDVKRPNIIFFLADDLRWDALGCTGNPVIQTPAIDALAEGGVRFTNAFVTTSICAVSRASYFTGQFESRHRIAGFGTPLTPEQWADTYPAILRKAGYRTGFIGKWGLGGDMPENEFDDWAGYPGQGKYFEKDDPKHLTVKLGEKALQFVESSAGKGPFQLSVSFKAPHVEDADPKQFLPDPQFDNLYTGVKVPVPPTATDAAFNAMPPFIQDSEARKRWDKRFPNPEKHQDSVKNYYRLINGIDRVVGLVMAKLDELKIRDNTVVIFSSDNGFFLGEHGLAGKWFPYQESIRIPMIIHDPRLPKSRRGQTADPFALNIDVTATILELAGAKIPEACQGRSLLPFVHGKSPKWRQDFFYEHHFEHPRIVQSEAVVNRQWKYIRYINETPPYEELFDLQADPFEAHDLASDKKHAPTLDTMRTRWRQLREKAK